MNIIVFDSDKTIKNIVEICRRYRRLNIAACCEDKEYVVDAKSLAAMKLLRDGGEVYFRAEGDKEQYDRFLQEIADASKEG